METHLEHEMKSCLEEMEKLQTKAKELQQKKIEQPLTLLCCKCTYKLPCLKENSPLSA